jgi:hypothetical protein
MIHKQTSKSWLVGVPVMLALFILAGCAARTVKPWGDPQTGLILQYRMPENQVLKYLSSGEMTMDMEVMGQAMEVKADETLAFTIKPKGMKENNYLLQVTIDSMSASISAPQGELVPDMSSVQGKSFDMTFSPIGEELDVSGAESIQYETEPGNISSMAPKFQAVFPDLAGRPVKIGDTWTTKATVTETSSKGESVISIESLNTLEGFEIVDGLECVRIKAEFTGTIEGKSEPEPGVELESEGDFKGAETWYFAYKEGIYVKTISSGTVEMTATAAAQGITIPMKRVFNNEMKLVK